MKSDKMKYILCAVFFTALAALTFRCVWPPDQVFAASDLNIGRLAYIKHLLPEIFVGYFRGVELFGVASYGVSLFNVLLAVLPLTLFANVFYGMVLVGGSMSFIWFLRMWDRSWLASVVGALVAFWVNSIMLASGGHAYKMEVLALSVLSLGLIEKAVRAERVRRSVGFSLLAGLVVGVMMIEQQDVALLAGLFVGSYALFRLVGVHGRTVGRWLAVLAPISVVALALSGSVILKSYDQNITKATSVQEEGDDKWNFITQWSMVPEEWPDLVALGWSGWSSHNPDGPYWGKLGQSAEWPETGKGFRNFKLTSVYFGVIPLLIGAFGFVAAWRNRRREDAKVMLFWSVAGVIGFLLAFGKYSLLYKGFYHLPLVGNIRAPIKLLDNFQICLGIVSAYGLDQLLKDGKGARSAKVLWVAASALCVLALSAGLKHLVFPEARVAEFTDMGFASFADLMARNMANGWFHAAVLLFALAGLVFVVWKGLSVARWAALAVLALLAADSLVLTSHYFQATDIKALKQGNVVVDFLKENQGDERVFFADSSGLYNQWIASDGPFHGLNIFNVWQISRMPADYKEYLGTVGRNQMRLWELASIKYIAAPGSIMTQLTANPQLSAHFHPALNYQVPTARGPRQDVLLEFKRAVPRFALYQGWTSVPLERQCEQLAGPAHNPRTTLMLDSASNLGERPAETGFQPLDAEVTKRSARLTVRTDQPGMVRFSQYYQPTWRVFVDGEPAALHRVDFLCMGVEVPAGEHVVEFRCPSGASRALFMLGVVIASIAVAIFLLRPLKKGDA